MKCFHTVLRIRNTVRKGISTYAVIGLLVDGLLPDEIVHY